MLDSLSARRKICWGAFFKHITPLHIGLIILTTVILIVTARIEEQKNIKFFGSAYTEYMQRSRLFIPFVL